MAFHPSVTDTMGALHLARQFLITLDRILEEDSSGSAPDSQPGKNKKKSWDFRLLETYRYVKKVGG